ncbi:hypothetical protein [Okeania sp. SIO1I7]|nr:hypothetical protein [Okeania sp. SIO1I7]
MAIRKKEEGRRKKEEGVNTILQKRGNREHGRGMEREVIDNLW